MEYIFLIIIGIIISFAFFILLLTFKPKNNTEKILIFLFEMFLIYLYINIYKEFNIRGNQFVFLIYYIIIPIIVYLGVNKYIKYDKYNIDQN